MSVVTSDPAVIEMDMTRWASAQARNIATHLLRTLHDYTPVDTGFARSNWVAAFGAPSEGVVGSKQAVSEGRFDSSFGLIATWNISSGSCFISNSVPYIGRLNDGWSKQAPAGFIEAAVAMAQAVAPTEAY